MEKLERSGLLDSNLTKPLNQEYRPKLSSFFSNLVVEVVRKTKDSSISPQKNTVRKSQKNRVRKLEKDFNENQGDDKVENLSDLNREDLHYKIHLVGKNSWNSYFF